MVNARRALVRALVVVGGAAAVSAVAWLTATASASTLTDITNEPIGAGVQTAVSAVSDPKPSVLPQAVERVDDVARGLSEAATRVDVLHAHAIPAVTTIPAAVLTLTDLTGNLESPDNPVEHVGKPPADPVAAESHDVRSAPAKTGSPEASTAPSAAFPLRPAAASALGEAHADLGADHGLGGLGGRSGLQAYVVPATAAFAAGGDRGCGDVAQPRSETRLQSSGRRNRVQQHAVVAAEIQPGVTPD
ncbi:hypothetical protein [Amycolatopsis sp. Hca4]|uniref:hypothetical protein n=1 Tax=Amycolatopsis sp. Hca4 TaxID=2742131 RepID=UPI00159177EF|nr:hypothetical protein [Amycolatopsis sp. Hca4]QKV76809.1 hypothetical protein HUT10_25780 [Amycolatopsis sp. Hca4]